jgi:hypothetical protein
MEVHYVGSPFGSGLVVASADSLLVFHKVYAVEVVALAAVSADAEESRLQRRSTFSQVEL